MSKLYLLSGIGRINHRLKTHLDNLGKDGEQHYANFLKVFRRVRTYYIIRNSAFLLLYAAIVSAMFSDIFLVGSVTTLLARLGGLIGGTMLVVIIFISDHLARLEMADAHVLASEVIALSVHQQQNTPASDGEQRT